VYQLFLTLRVFIMTKHVLLIIYNGGREGVSLIYVLF